MPSWRWVSCTRSGASPQKARKVIREAREKASKEHASAYWLATVYAALNDKEEAFREPRFASLHTDPCLHDLIRRMGLEHGNI